MKDKHETAGKPIRYTLILGQEAHARLIDITKRHVISQAEVIEALLLESKPEDWEPVFARLRDEKVGKRTSKRAMLSRLAKLPPEELARLQALATNKPE